MYLFFFPFSFSSLPLSFPFPFQSASVHIERSLDNPDLYPRMTDPSSSAPIQPGSVVPSQRYPTGRSVVVEEQPDLLNAKLTDTRVTRDWVRRMTIDELNSIATNY